MKGKLICVLVSLILGITLCELLSRPVFLRRFANGKFVETEPTVLIIGDSQSLFYPEKLRKRLFPVNVINASKSGTGFDHYFAKMNRIAGAFSPDVIVVAVYAGNDISGIRDFLHAPYEEAIKLFFAQRLSIYHLVKEAYTNFKYREYRTFQMKLEDNTFSNTSPIMIAAARDNPEAVIENILIGTPELEACWLLVDGFIGRMKSFSDKHDTPLVVLVIPDPVQVNRKYETIYAQAGFKIPDDGLMLTRIQNRLERISGRYGAQFLDPLPQLRSLANQDLFYTNDPHLNDAGQSAIAEILAVYLRRTIGVCTP